MIALTYLPIGTVRPVAAGGQRGRIPVGLLRLRRLAGRDGGGRPRPRHPVPHVAVDLVAVVRDPRLGLHRQAPVRQLHLLQFHAIAC